MPWLSESPSWSEENGILTVTTADKSDFWRKTHYGFIRDNGHVYAHEVAGDFSATVTFTAEYRELYDQAGLMLRIDDQNWIKAGIEYTDGKHHLSAVVTRDFSDWSVLPLEGDPGPVRLRLSRYGEAVRVEYAFGEGGFQMLRLAHLHASESALVGPMCCSPERAGLVAKFWDFEIGEPATTLHG